MGQNRNPFDERVGFVLYLRLESVMGEKIGFGPLGGADQEGMR